MCPDPASTPDIDAVIVDDNVDLADALAIHLGLAGLKVEVAHSYDAAEMLLEKCSPRFLITDQVFPAGRRGTDLAAYAMICHPDIRVILMTAATDTIVEEDAIAVGISLADVVHKPLDVPTVLRFLGIDPNANPDLRNDG